MIILSAATLSGQGRHSIKIGVGTNLMWDVDNGYNYDKSMGTIYTLGPTLHIDYGYKLNKYIELGVNAFSLTNRYGASYDAMAIGALAKFVYTPLPKTFRHVRLGVGAGWINTQYLRTDLMARTQRRNEFAFDYYIRAYAIDNERFELYGSYGLSYSYYAPQKILFWTHSNVSLHFGVKF